MKTKEEVIKEAWGELWGKINKRGKEQAFEDNGYCHKNYIIAEISLETESLPYHDNKFIRPKSLNGIENNNGWIKINSEEDFPKESGEYWVVHNNKISHRIIVKDSYIDKYTTHYQPIEKPKPPLY